MSANLCNEKMLEFGFAICGIAADETLTGVYAVQNDLLADDGVDRKINLYETVPCDEHDRFVDMIITEDEIIEEVV